MAGTPTTTWIAFLRGINLGKRRMKMAELRECCEGIGLTDVRTILASGNVRFDAADAEAEDLLPRFEAALEGQFGFAAKVVLRTADELAAMVALDPFGALDPEADLARHVLMSQTPIRPMPEFDGLPSHIEVPRCDPREIYIVAHRLPNGRYTEGLEHLGALLPAGLVVTMRNWNTILKALA